MSLLMDNARRTVSIGEQAKVETIIELYEMGFIKTETDKRKIITEILQKMFFKKEEIDYWMEYFEL